MDKLVWRSGPGTADSALFKLQGQKSYVRSCYNTNTDGQENEMLPNTGTIEWATI